MPRSVLRFAPGLLAVFFLGKSALADTMLGPAKTTDVTAAEARKLEDAFAEAYADARRDRVLVTRTSDASTPPADPSAEARRLGATEYVSLAIARESGSILVRGTRYDVAGEVLGFSRVSFPSEAEGRTAMSDLARALASDGPTVDRAPASPRVRNPSPPTRPRDDEAEEEEDDDDEPTARPAYASAPAPGEPREVKRFETVLGPKMGVFGAWAEGYSFAPFMTLGFDAKIEQDGYFVEVGGGAAIPAGNRDGGTVAMGGAYVEMGAAAYLTGGDVGPYLGGGILPRIWAASGPNGGGAFANVAGYGQFGVMFLRTRSMRVYFDGRAALSITEVVVPGGVDPVTGQARPGAGLHPLEFGAEFGLGW